MDERGMTRLVDLVFAPDPTGGHLGSDDLDLVEALVGSQQFDEFGRRVFRALMERSLAALQARRTVAVARLQALMNQCGGVQ